MEIKDYREHIKRIARERKGETVYNGSADHAAIIMENLFASAQQCVRIFTGDLNAKVYGAAPVVQRARQFLGHSDHVLQVIVEDLTVSSSHPLIEELAEEDGFEMYQLDQDLSKHIPYHFSTADADCFRFEREKNSHSAIAAFGDSETTEHLNDVFSEMLKLCTKVDKAQFLN
ncbi:DUF7931 domain-containing protein [Novosphingobium naphthalenivorans]|uniref:DUF7931 domain-containing protein n=1 Tax=Novosphingobium naphthalenivorans TaxID=273168 RepID=UPI000B2C159B|nr:hypothetical protein [Novosphingobium naphthalenivorans]